MTQDEQLAELNQLAKEATDDPSPTAEVQEERNNRTKAVVDSMYSSLPPAIMDPLRNRTPSGRHDFFEKIKSNSSSPEEMMALLQPTEEELKGFGFPSKTPRDRPEVPASDSPSASQRSPPEIPTEDQKSSSDSPIAVDDSRPKMATSSSSPGPVGPGNWLSNESKSQSRTSRIDLLSRVSLSGGPSATQPKTHFAIGDSPWLSNYPQVVNKSKIPATSLFANSQAVDFAPLEESKKTVPLALVGKETIQPPLNPKGVPLALVEKNTNQPPTQATADIPDSHSPTTTRLADSAGSLAIKPSPASPDPITQKSWAVNVSPPHANLTEVLSPRNPAAIVSQVHTIFPTRDDENEVVKAWIKQVLKLRGIEQEPGWVEKIFWFGDDLYCMGEQELVSDLMECGAGDDEALGVARDIDNARKVHLASE
jgi:hypothetical protein